MTERLSVHHYESPSLGWIELCVSDRGVRSLAYVSASTEKTTTPSHPIVDRLVRELDEYFQGKRFEFTVPLDLDMGTSFQRAVWEELRNIPWGETRSYGDVAVAIDNPKAARAVGLANGANNITIIIPCHRVVHADGSLGGYSSGLDKKRVLLELERSNLP
jgi:methylated-DNA-[protein]-cysteine S-methyltransferase